MHDKRTALLGLDWGTTSLRAYRLGQDGSILDTRASEAGILRVAGGDFAAALVAAIGDWLAAAPEAPVIASGMIGSRQGWVEVPYVPCPAGLPQLARGLGTARLPGGRVAHVVPGVLRPADDAVFPDVMRGEETQIFGAHDGSGGRYVLPGTHSKWATCEAGLITDFTTYMTGEVFDVLRRHSILGRLMTGEAEDEAAFGRGLRQAHQSAGAPPGRLLHDLFSARTLGLTGAMPEAGLASYLSGLLIGSELQAALARSGAGRVTVLGSGGLTALYARALTTMGADVVAGAPDAAAHGLHAIAVAANLVEADAHA